MSFTEDLERWCWQDPQRLLDSEQLQQLAQKLTGTEALSRDELTEHIQQTLEKLPQPPSPDAFRQIEQYMQQQLADRIPPGGGSQGQHSGQERRSSNSQHPSSGDDAFGSLQNSPMQQIAGTMLRQAGNSIPEDQRPLFEQQIDHITTFSDLERFTDALAKHLPQPAPANGRDEDSERRDAFTEADGVPGGTRSDGELGKLISEAAGTFSAADGFQRTIAQADDPAQFDGIENPVDQQVGTAEADSESGAAMQVVRGLSKQHKAILKKSSRRLHTPVSARDIRHIIEQLLQQRILSSTFTESFQVNRDRVSYLMAKKAFADLQRRIRPRRHLRPGTHASGTRGRLAVEPDKLQRTRYLTSRIAAFHTLQRGLFRRTLYPQSTLLDEDDLIEYGGRKKVGYSIIVAIDISGAVQFGKRIHQVRKACMAFGYYLRRYHPYDRVRYLAYHENQREIDFSDISRLRSVNGAGKDIGGCLSRCRRILRRDPDRIPVVILIGDGLPVRGDQAGIYRFKENNRTVIESAYHQARMLSKEHINFIFLQFAEERHFWEDLADETAGRVVHEARGLRHRISSSDDVGRALLESSRRIRSQQPPAKRVP